MHCNPKLTTLKNKATDIRWR